MATVVCAVIAWVFVVKLPGVDLSVLLAGERRHIGLSDIVIAATVCSAAGVILLRVLERRVKNPLRLWSVIAVLVAVGSMSGTGSAVSSAATAALISLHAVVAAVVIAAAWRSRS